MLEQFGFDAASSRASDSLTDFRSGKKKRTASKSIMDSCDGSPVGLCRGELTLPVLADSADNVKHHAVAFLYTKLKSPATWTADVFPAIEALFGVVRSTALLTTLPVPYGDRTYRLHLTGTMIMGRLQGVSRGTKEQCVNDALKRIRVGQGAILNLGKSRYFLVVKATNGLLLYARNVLGSPVLMFFGCLAPLLAFIGEAFELRGTSKYSLSTVELHSVQSGNVVHIRMRRTKRKNQPCKLLNAEEALLLGRKYLEKPNLPASLALALAAIERAAVEQLRSWDSNTMDALFGQSEAHGKRATRFLKDGMLEVSPRLGTFRAVRGTHMIHHRQRVLFEDILSLLLPRCEAVLVFALDCCFVLWEQQGFLYWFSPFRYITLDETEMQRHRRAAFLYTSSSMDRFSLAIFEYLMDIGVYPEHGVALISLQTTTSEMSLECGSEESFTYDALDVRIADPSPTWPAFYTRIHSESAIQFTRQMFNSVYGLAEQSFNGVPEE